MQETMHIISNRKSTLKPDAYTVGDIPIIVTVIKPRSIEVIGMIDILFEVNISSIMINIEDITTNI